MVLHGQGGYIRAKVVVIGKKVVVFGQNWLYWGRAVVFEQKWLYSGKSGSVRTKVVVFGSSG